MSSEEFDDWIQPGMQGEWVRGKGIIFMPASKEHQFGALLLADLITRFARLFGLGEAVISPFEMRVLGGESRREPDIVFVATAHLDRLIGTRLDGAADLAVELVSPDSVKRDLQEKFAEYQEAGVSEYLVVDFRERSRRFELYRLDEAGTYQLVHPDDDGRIHFASMPGFWLKPEWLWQEPLPDSLTLLRRISPGGWRRLVEQIDAAS